MAKRKRKKSAARRAPASKTTIVRVAPARAPARRRRARRRSSGGGIGMGGLMPNKHALKSWAGAGLYGYLESQARSDGAAVLNKVPKFVPQLGFAGNVAVAAWTIGHFAKVPVLKSWGNSVAHVAAYQLGHHGAVFSEPNEQFTVSGPGGGADLDPDELEHLAAAMADAADDDVSGDLDDE